MGDGWNSRMGDDISSWCQAISTGHGLRGIDYEELIGIPRGSRDGDNWSTLNWLDRHMEELRRLKRVEVTLESIHPYDRDVLLSGFGHPPVDLPWLLRYLREYVGPVLAGVIILREMNDLERISKGIRTEMKKGSTNCSLLKSLKGAAQDDLQRAKKNYSRCYRSMG